MPSFNVSIPHTLDAAEADRRLGWRPWLSMEDTVAMTARWYAGWAGGADAADRRPVLAAARRRWSRSQRRRKHVEHDPDWPARTDA